MQSVVLATSADTEVGGGGKKVPQTPPCPGGVARATVQPLSNPPHPESPCPGGLSVGLYVLNPHSIRCPEHLRSSPHHSSPFLPVSPYPRHPLPLPTLGAFPYAFPYPSPALLGADPRHLAAPIPSTCSFPACGTYPVPTRGTCRTILIDTSSAPDYTRTIAELIGDVTHVVLDPEARYGCPSRA
jgi:hypothetical protein